MYAKNAFIVKKKLNKNNQPKITRLKAKDDMTLTQV